MAKRYSEALRNDLLPRQALTSYLSEIHTCAGVESCLRLVIYKELIWLKEELSRLQNFKSELAGRCQWPVLARVSLS